MSEGNDFGDFEPIERVIIGQPSGKGGPIVHKRLSKELDVAGKVAYIVVRRTDLAPRKV